MSVNINVPYAPGSYVYRVIKDKRVKEPHKCKVMGYWISADSSRSEVHLVHYVNDTFDYSIAIPLTEIHGTIFESEISACIAMKDR